MSYYAMQCITATTLGYVYINSVTCVGTDGIVYRMIITKTPFIIPSRLEWFGLLLMIGFVGFVSQILLTLGLQRESAGRASMAIYTQACASTYHRRWWLILYPDCVRYGVPVYILPHDSLVAFHARYMSNLIIGLVRRGEREALFRIRHALSLIRRPKRRRRKSKPSKILSAWMAMIMIM